MGARRFAQFVGLGVQIVRYFEQLTTGALIIQLSGKTPC
jgi:hypothetical protein